MDVDNEENVGSSKHHEEPPKPTSDPESELG